MVGIDINVLNYIKIFLEELKKRGFTVEKAYLFGSYAKGTENRWSDIDVAIVSPEIKDDRYEERIRLMKIAVNIDSRIEPVPFNPETFTDEDPFVREIKREGLILQQD